LQVVRHATRGLSNREIAAELELDTDSGDAALEQLALADPLLLGRKTYEGLAPVWPQLAQDPSMAHFAKRVNSMPRIFDGIGCSSVAVYTFGGGGS
jgi:hypothetical protein